MTTREFLQALFAGCAGFLELRYLPKDGEASQQFRPVDDLSWLRKWGPDGRADVYFGVYPRTRSAGTADAVAPEVTWLYSDLDGSERPMPQALAPTIVVDSGTAGHKHCYWRLRQPVGVAEAEAANKALARALGGDLNATDRARVLRLPGTVNSKTNREAAVTHYDPDATYELADFASLMSADILTSPSAAVGGASAVVEAPSLRSTSTDTAQMLRQGERNASLASLAGTMRRRGMSEQAICAALLAENEQRCDPPLSEDEVRRIAHSVARYEPGAVLPVVTTTDGSAGRPQSSAESAAHAVVPAEADSAGVAPVAHPWPEPLAWEAFHGLAGDFLRLVEPHTEADPAAVLLSYFVAFGNVVGRRPHFVADGARHYTNLYGVLVGRTARSRKGSSWAQVRRPFETVDADWALDRIQYGLSSGEGLIWAVRDPIEKHEPVRQGGRVTDYQDVTEDPGVTDKRLLVVEQEFASTLRVMGRDGNTLSPTIRQAWETGDLRILTKNSPASATGSHISILGHITRDEVLRYLDTTEAGNGFANRFLWVCVSRSKLLPEGGQIQEVDFAPFTRRLRAAVEFARGVGEMKRDDEARGLWHQVYPDLSQDTPGMLGAVIARAEPQAMRLACIYALLDQSAIIRREHLDAALAVWDYCEASARFIFGDALGDPMADEILRLLRQAENGLTRTEISNHFGRNRSASQISRALTLLQESGLAECRPDAPVGGRPAERWYALGPGRRAHSQPTKETNETK